MSRSSGLQPLIHWAFQLRIFRLKLRQMHPQGALLILADALEMEQPGSPQHAITNQLKPCKYDGDGLELVHKRGRFAAWRLAFSAQLDGGEEDCAASLRRVYFKCCFPENNWNKNKNCSALEAEALSETIATSQNHIVLAGAKWNVHGMNAMCFKG